MVASTDRTLSDMEPTRERLAIYIAKGSSASAAGKKLGINPRRARRWSNDPDVRALVASLRHAVADRCLGVLAASLPEAATAMTGLLKSTDTPAATMAKLAVSKEVMGQFVVIHKHVELDARMARIEEMLGL
jgi:hypothetical protein